MRLRAIATYIPIILLSLLMLRCSSEGSESPSEQDSTAIDSLASLQDIDSTKLVQDSLFQQPDTLNRFFSKHGATGAFVLFDPQKSQYYYHNKKRAQELLPAGGLFPPLLVLMALESGAIPDTSTIIQWNGEKNSEHEEWNKNHLLKEALIQHTDWVFDDLAKKVGDKRTKFYLNKLQYGNRNPGTAYYEEGNYFWEDGTLRVSLNEQIALLRSFYRETLPFNPRNIEYIKRYAFQHQETPAYTLSLLPAQAIANDSPVVWHLGYLIFKEKEEEDGSRTPPKGYYFGVVVDATKENASQLAEGIVIDILKEVKLL